MSRAVQLDLRLSRREILAEYPSRTPYGGNVEAHRVLAVELGAAQHAR